MQLDLDGRGTLYEQLARALKRSILEETPAGGLPPPRDPRARRRARPVAQHRPDGLRAALRREHGGVEGWLGTYVADAAIVKAVRPPVESVPPQSRYAARLRRLPPSPLHRFDPPVRYDLQYGEPLLRPAARSPPGAGSCRAPHCCSELRYPAGSTACASCAKRSARVPRAPARAWWCCGRPTWSIVNGAQQAIALLPRACCSTAIPAVSVEDPGTISVRRERLPGAWRPARRRAHRRRGGPPTGRRCRAAGARLRARDPRRTSFPPASRCRSRAAWRCCATRPRAATAGVVEDDYDGEFRYARGAVPALRSLDVHHRVIYIGSFSKVVFPALRLGYLVCRAACATTS